MHPIAILAIKLPLLQHKHLKKQVQSSCLSVLKLYYTQMLVLYIKVVFLSRGLIGERVEPSWTLNSPLSYKLTSNKWTMFQKQFIEGWLQHVEQHSCDIFQVENQPAFHVYDFGANIEITISKYLQSLEKERRLQIDNNIASNLDDNSNFSEDSNSIGPISKVDLGPYKALGSTNNNQPLDLNLQSNAPSSLYSNGL